MDINLRGRQLIAGVLACALLAFVLTACQPGQENTGDASGSAVSPVGDNSVVRGEYDAFDPEVNAAETGGEAIEGSEEDELQQERIAGGATGAVVSQNLEPLTGITDPSDGDYIASFGSYMQAPPMNMSDPQPLSHLRAQLSADECADCHVTQ